MPRSFADKRRAAVDATMRDEVYRTSVKIITEEGIVALTLDRIAKEIGVSRPTLYNYFPDRAGIVTFIENRAFEPLGALLEEIVAAEGAAQDKLAQICTAVIDSVYRERALVLAIFHKEMLEGVVKDAKAAKRERAVALISKVLEHGIESGELRPLPVQAAAEVILGAITGLVDSMVYSGSFRTADEVVPPMLDVLLRGLEKTANTQ
jgi:AcrR family transcriptional regulator